MENIANYIGQPIHWVQPRIMHQYFDLCTDTGTVLATLQLDRGFGMNGRAEFAEGVFTFERKGLLKPIYSIRTDSTGMAVARYSPKVFARGTLEFQDGRSYQFFRPNFWQSRWSFVDPLGVRVVSFANEWRIQSLADIFKIRGRVEIAPEITDRQGLPLMISLGWYLLMLRRRRQKG